jgi:hypothetical protein
MLIDLEKSAIKNNFTLEQELRTRLEKLLTQYEERLPQITNGRFWTDREEAYANGQESQLEDVISDLKAILQETKS